MAELSRETWAKLEEDYRCGTFSNVQLGRKYGVGESTIRKRAKKFQWEKDLSHAVRDKVKDKLVRGARGGREPRTGGRSDDEIIDEAAERGAEIIEFHRKDIRTLREVAAGLMTELRENKAVLRATGKKTKVSLRDRSQIFANLTQAAARYIPLERQAYNLDEHDANSDKVFFDLGKN